MKRILMLAALPITMLFAEKASANIIGSFGVVVNYRAGGHYCDARGGECDMVWGIFLEPIRIDSYKLNPAPEGGKNTILKSDLLSRDIPSFSGITFTPEELGLDYGITVPPQPAIYSEVENGWVIYYYENK